MKFLNYNITSRFMGVGSREIEDDFKGSYQMLYPKYNVFLDDKSFEYSGSAMDLGKMLRLKGETLYLKDNKEIWQSVGYRKRAPIGYEDNLHSNLSRMKTLEKLNSTLFNKKQSTLELSEENLLFAFRCIIEDSIIPEEFIDEFEFGEMMGYSDMREAQRVYKLCIDTKLKLNISSSEYEAIMDELIERGIE